MRFHEDQQTGALMSRIINDSNMFESLISHAVPDTLVNIMRLIGVAISTVDYQREARSVDADSRAVYRLDDARHGDSHATGVPRAAEGVGRP